MHGKLEPEENVFVDKDKEEEIEGDIEEMKKAIIKSAEESWDKYAGG